jgi:glucose/arabinose dehydrogenase
MRYARMSISLTVAAMILAGIAPSSRPVTQVAAQSGPTVFDPDLGVRTVVTGLNQPTSMAFLGEDDFLVIEKARAK